MLLKLAEKHSSFLQAFAVDTLTCSRTSGMSKRRSKAGPQAAAVQVKPFGASGAAGSAGTASLGFEPSMSSWFAVTSFSGLAPSISSLFRTFALPEPGGISDGLTEHCVAKQPTASAPAREGVR